jgi:hypothetical protein
MTERTFEEGYREGWMSVAGDEPVPDNWTCPPEHEAASFDDGFLYGRSEAALHFRPGTGDLPPRPTGL